MSKPAKRVLVALLCLLASSPALAIEPAGGPPVPPGMDPQDFVSPSDLPDASVEDRGWLAESPAEEPARLTPSANNHNPLLSLLALLLVASLGGGALWLQRRKAKAVTPAGVESRLTLLSSTRIGPKAFAVSAEVNGRVILLGVTDQQVTNLGWLDPPELEHELRAEEPEAAAADEDDLPDDYPGSALREAARQASSLMPGSLQPPPPQASQLTSTQNLKRFQEVLRGAIPDHPQSMRAPRMTPPVTSAELFGRSVPPLSDAATTLAAMTSDVVGSEPAAGRSVAPASLRRKRQRRAELTKPAKQSSKAPASESAAPPSIEGQVAGLRALKNG